MTLTTSTSQSLSARLEQFRTQFTYHTTTLGDHQWPYYMAGDEQAEALLLLSGGGAHAEAMFPFIMGFSPYFRVIAPDYPVTLRQLSDAISGLRALLAENSISRCIVVGLSFGGMLAQSYIRRFPDSVIDLIITHTMIPSQHLSEAMQMHYQLVRWMPEPLLLWLNRRTFLAHLAQSVTPTTQRPFWEQYIEAQYQSQMKKGDFIMRARLTREYHSENEFNSRDLLNWPGDLLIIESGQDDVISDGDRGSLKAMYSRAYIQTLEDADHFAPLLAADSMTQSMINFLHREMP